MRLQIIFFLYIFLKKIGIISVGLLLAAAINNWNLKEIINFQIIFVSSLFEMIFSVVVNLIEQEKIDLGTNFNKHIEKIVNKTYFNINEVKKSIQSIIRKILTIILLFILIVPFLFIVDYIIIFYNTYKFNSIILIIFFFISECCRISKYYQNRLLSLHEKKEKEILELSNIVMKLLPEEELQKLSIELEKSFCSEYNIPNIEIIDNKFEHKRLFTIYTNKFLRNKYNI